MINISIKGFLFSFALILFSLPIQTFAQDVELEVLTDIDPFICQNEEIEFTYVADQTPDSTFWTLDGNVIPSSENLQTFTIAFDEAGSQEVAIVFFLNDEEFTATVSVEVDEFEIPEFTTRDTTVCRHDHFPLTTTEGLESMTFEWTPDTSVSDPNIANALATPDDTTVLYLNIISENGYCTFTDSVIVNVLPNNVNIQLPPTAFVCDDSPQIRLNTSVDPPGSEIQWFPNDGSLSSNTEQSPLATLDFTTRYIVNIETPDGCMHADTVIVRLDSLPEFEYSVIPGPREPCEKYCVGDFFTIFSNIANPERFPDITYNWRPEDGSIQDSVTFQNISVVAQTTQYYIRTNTNNACQSMDSIWIEVVDPDIPVNFRDTTVCANEPVQIMIDDTDLTDLEWSPAQGLSCTDCPNPIVTTPQTTTYTLNATKEECCPVSVSVTVVIFYPPIPIEPLTACPGEPIQIIVDSEGFSNPQWVTNTDQLSCDDCFEPIAVVNTDTQFELRAFDEDNCESIGVASIGVFPMPDVMELDVSPGEEIPIGTEGTFTLNVSPSIDVDEVNWFYNGDLVETGTRTAMIEIIEENENNFIRVEFLDANGCMRVLEVTIDGVEPIFEVPNVFSPGGQTGINQFFRPVVVNADEFDGSFVTDFKVFNRWGQKVYDNDNNEEGWNGRQNGSQAPADVYVYVIEITLPNGRTRTLKGDVTLLR